MGRFVLAAARPVEQFFQFSLLGLVASGFAAVLGAGVLEWHAIILGLLGIVVQTLVISGHLKWEVPASWANAFTLLLMGYYPLQGLSGSDDVIHKLANFVVVLAILRLLTAKSDRDYFFVKLIAFLELLAATLVSQSPTFFVFLTVFLFFGIATFCCSDIRRSTQGPAKIASHPANFHPRLAALTFFVGGGIVVMSAGLFFLLPRTARAALSSVLASRYHLSGFSNDVTLGRVGELKQESTPVMHVRISEPYVERQFKWRGGELTQFDGNRWSNPSMEAQRIPVTQHHAYLIGYVPIEVAGSRFQYEVRLDRPYSRVLFFAGTPESIQINSRALLRTPANSYRSSEPLNSGATYSATAYAQFEPPVPTPLSEDSRIEHLLLPPVDRRVISLSRELALGKTPAQAAEAIEKFLLKFEYSTDLLDRPVEDPLAHFLFDRRKGHCEYFASAMAVMLRAVHIPSRVATGFNGGQYNPLTGWQVIRASDAHTWVEAYLPGRGWVTFDPTPGGTGNAGSTLFSRFGLYLDAAETFWSQWVLTYNLDRQVELAARVERRWHTLEQLDLDALNQRAKNSLKSIFDRAGAIVGWMLLAVTAAAALAYYGPRVWHTILSRRHVRKLRNGQIGSSDAAVLYGRMLQLLRKAGYEKPAWLTPAEFATLLPASDLSRLVQQFTAAYQDLRYSGDGNAGVKMLALLHELELSKPAR